MYMHTYYCFVGQHALTLRIFTVLRVLHCSVLRPSEIWDGVSTAVGGSELVSTEAPSLVSDDNTTLGDPMYNPV